MTPCSLTDSNNVFLREVTRSNAIHSTVSTVKLKDPKLSFLQPPQAKGCQVNNISESFQFASLHAKAYLGSIDKPSPRKRMKACHIYLILCTRKHPDKFHI